MALTTSGFPYPLPTDPPDISRDVRALAETVGARLEGSRPKTWSAARTGNASDTVPGNTWGSAVSLTVPSAPVGTYLMIAQFDVAATNGIWFEVAAGGTVITTGSDNGPRLREVKQLIAVHTTTVQESVVFSMRFGFGVADCTIYKDRTSLGVVWLG
jgi:hypothetical protein